MLEDEVACYGCNLPTKWQVCKQSAYLLHKFVNVWVINKVDVYNIKTSGVEQTAKQVIQIEHNIQLARGTHVGYIEAWLRIRTWVCYKTILDSGQR